MLLNFADNFKLLRKEKNMTQEKVADALEVSGQSVSRWEQGICYPDVELLPTIANFFGVTVDYLLSNEPHSKERDRELFLKTLNTLSDTTSEQIDFVREYCRKYPGDDFYAYQLIAAIRRHVVGDEAKTKKYMPLMLKYVDKLMETRYRNVTIQLMATVCDEGELEKWLAMAPYASGFNRRYCLVARALARESWEECYIQQGLEAMEDLARQLDRRCPDPLGAEKKAEYQQDVLKIIRAFGNDGEIPDGWKLFYAYKQLVLSACLFGQGQIEDGWKNFHAAISICHAALDVKDEWLSIGGALFSDLKVSRDWNYAIDQNGTRHKLFAMVNLSNHDLRHIFDLLTNPRWAWFNAVRDTPEYQSALAWIGQKADELKTAK